MTPYIAIGWVFVSSVAWGFAWGFARGRQARPTSPRGSAKIRADFREINFKEKPR